MGTLPTVELAGHRVSRLICGRNPQSGYSHVSDDLDWEMIRYYTMPNIQKLLAECWTNGINTHVSRGDRLQMRAHLEHRANGGHMQWIAQTACEFSRTENNISEIARYEPIAICHNGTHADNCWHRGEVDKVQDILRMIHDRGLPAGIASHIPEVIEYVEEKGWDTDFYMCCFYDLARGYKAAPAVDRDAYARDRFPPGDPRRMAKDMRSVPTPCLGFKVLAASRNCSTPGAREGAFTFAFDHIKANDAVVVGMFQKRRNQAAENAQFVREILLEAEDERADTSSGAPQ